MTSLFSSPTLGLIGGVSNSILQGYATYNQQLATKYANAWNSAQYDMQAAMAESKAKAFRQLGEVEYFEAIQEYTAVANQQRAEYGASGVNVNVGSAIAVQADTMAQGVYAAQKAQYDRNAAAIDLENQASAARLNSSFAANAPDTSVAAAITASSAGLTSTYGTYGTWRKQS